MLKSLSVPLWGPVSKGHSFSLTWQTTVAFARKSCPCAPFPTKKIKCIPTSRNGGNKQQKCPENVIIQTKYCKLTVIVTWHLGVKIKYLNILAQVNPWRFCLNRVTCTCTLSLLLIIKVTRTSYFVRIPSYFEALWHPHLYFDCKSNI